MSNMCFDKWWVHKGHRHLLGWWLCVYTVGDRTSCGLGVGGGGTCWQRLALYKHWQWESVSLNKHWGNSLASWVCDLMEGNLVTLQGFEFTGISFDVAIKMKSECVNVLWVNYFWKHLSCVKKQHYILDFFLESKYTSFVLYLFQF